MPLDIHAALARCGWLGRSFGYEAVIASATVGALPAPPRVSVILVTANMDAHVFAGLEKMAKASSCPLQLVIVEQQSCYRPLPLGVHTWNRCWLGRDPMPFGDMAHVHIRLNGDVNLHTARNIGALFAEGSCLVFLSDMFSPLPNLVDTWLACFEEHKPLAARGAAKSADLNSGVPVGNLFRAKPSGPWIVDIDENLAVEANAFYALGGFDETLLEGCGAVDLSIRLYGLCPDLTRQRYQADAVVVAGACFDPQRRHLLRQAAWDGLNRKWMFKMLEYYEFVAESLCGEAGVTHHG